MFSNVNEVVFELVNTVGVRDDGVALGWWYLTLCNVEHALPPINNLPLFHHTGHVRVSNIYEFTSFLVVFGPIDAGLGDGV